MEYLLPTTYVIGQKTIPGCWFKLYLQIGTFVSHILFCEELIW